MQTCTLDVISYSAGWLRLEDYAGLAKSKDDANCWAMYDDEDW